MADFQTISTFFALLGLAAALAAASLGLLRVLSPEGGWRRAAEVVAPSALVLAGVGNIAGRFAGQIGRGDLERLLSELAGPADDA